MPTLSSNIVKREIASVHDVEEALARQSLYGGDLVTNLLELARVSEDRLTRAVAESVGLEPAPAGELPRAVERVRKLVPGDVAQRYALYPLTEAEGRLVVAVSEPLPGEVVSDLEFSLGLSLEQRAATLVRVQQAVCRDYGLDLDRRVARVLARLNGTPDPTPTMLPETTSAAPQEPEAPPTQVSGPPPVSSMPALQEPRTAMHSSLPVIPKLDVAALARAEARANRRRRRLGPYTAAMAEADLRDAETRDEVMGAFFDFASQYFEYSALFAVHGDLLEGRDAHGSGAARAKVLAIGVPLDLPSTLALVMTGDFYRIARLSSAGLDGALAKDLERRPGKAVLLLPICVRQRPVLVLYGDHGANDVELASVGDILSFAPLVASALERVILLRKGVPQPGRIPGNRRERYKSIPNVQDRANALATALVDAPLAPIARISSFPDAPEVMPARSDVPVRRESAVARPVISVGPKRTHTPPQGAVIPKLPALPAELTEDTSQTPTPLVTRAYSFRPTRPTPVPSSLAPGAPPGGGPLRAHPSVTIAFEPGAEEDTTVPGANGRAPSQTALPRTSSSTPASPTAPTERELLAARPAMPGDDAPPSGFGTTNEIPSVVPPETRPGLGSPPPPKPERRTTPLSTPPLPAQRASGAGLLAPDSARRLELVADAEGSPPDVEIEEAPVEEASLEEILAADSESHIPLIPQSRSLAHSARPLPPPGYSEELRLPTVIVDLANDTEALVVRLIEGDPTAGDRLVELGAPAVPALVGAFPGPILSELRRTVGDGPPRASECGPVLKVLARIGARAAGVLSVRTNDGRPDVRAWATRLLGEMPCLDAARAVARRFVDDDPDVRRAALAAGRMLQAHSAAGPPLSGTLAEMLLDSSRKAAQTHMIIEAVADLREARTIPALAALLATGSAEVQRSAHWALVVLARHDYGNNAAAWDQWWRVNSGRHRIEWLIDALMHESAEIRRAAGDELKSVTKEYFGYYDDLPARERERAQRRYREWWETKGKARFGAQHP
jgi:hypothetical protein